jgi:alpha-beta hydrolase superfamily lysophospholipase
MRFEADPKTLANIVAPTLVIQGSHDALVPPEEGEALAKAIGGAHLIMLEGLGHEITPALFDELRDTVDAHIGLFGSFVLRDPRS